MSNRELFAKLLREHKHLVPEGVYTLEAYAVFLRENRHLDTDRPPVVTIAALDEPKMTHSTHTVTIYSEAIYTVVTHTPSIVDQYFSEIYRIHRCRLNRLVVGLDIEWRPSFTRGVQPPVATLQLCVGRRCLIFQLIHASSIPQSLVDFLNNPTFRFVGVGIKKDVEKLWEGFNLWVPNAIDLRPLAMEKITGVGDLRNVGLMDLALVVHGMEIEKPKSVTLSDWDKKWLDDDQIQYACTDAYVSFEIGRELFSRH